MEYIIEKGNHYCNQWYKTGIHTGKFQGQYLVNFTDSCRAEAKEDDWNKLVGWSYGLHHKNSIRLAWRYSKEEDMIQLAIYIYMGGYRYIFKLCSVQIDKTYNIFLQNDYSRNKLICDVTSTDSCFEFENNFFSLKPTWGYTLDPYYGGDNPAPRRTKIYLEELK